MESKSDNEKGLLLAFLTRVSAKLIRCRRRGRVVAVERGILLQQIKGYMLVFCN
jgi:hypothetical protein